MIGAGIFDPYNGHVSGGHVELYHDLQNSRAWVLTAHVGRGIVSSLEIEFPNHCATRIFAESEEA